MNKYVGAGFTEAFLNELTAFAQPAYVYQPHI